ncbi:unnamed protein product [Owenia fusiformis]|uniref:Uncharacterized protein n=1 Tax=Owenia fusiformis TaxID=6347 RepID=A0A8J1U7K2_OWEFU|nr:unnamed protein product [Owenia fusiformis]
MASNLLKSTNYASSLLTGLKDMRDTAVLCDFTLVAEKNEFKVHQAVLAGCSDYFRAMFTIDMQEKGKNVIELLGVPAQGLTILLDFIYSGELRCTLDNISDVLIAATHLQVTDAINMCNNYLEELTDRQNCTDMYNVGDHFDLQKVKDKAMGYILSHFEDITDNGELMKFSAKFLTMILVKDSLRISSELKLYETVLSWIRFDSPNRLQYIYSLMSCVRFPLMSPVDLVEKVMTEPMMKENMQCLELILEANSFHMLPVRRPSLVSPRMQIRNEQLSLIAFDIEDSERLESTNVLDVETYSWHTLYNCNLETYLGETCSIGSYLYMCGGIELFSCAHPVSAKCYRYDPRFDEWEMVASMQEPRHDFALASDDKSLFAIGGVSSGSIKGIVERYSPRRNQWLPCKPLVIPVKGLASSHHGGNIYITGGEHTGNAVSNKLWMYNIKQDTWHEKSPMLQCRMDHGMCTYQDQLYVIAGYGKNLFKAYDVPNIEVYNIELNQWTIISQNSPKTSSINAVLIETKVYLVGGFSYDDNQKRSDVLCYNIDTNEWDIVAKISAPAMSVPCTAIRLPKNIFD